MIALVGFMPNVSGRRSATPDVEPMPGSAPTSVPRNAPTNAKSRLAGVSAIAKPAARFEKAHSGTSIYGSGTPSQRTKISHTRSGVASVAAPIASGRRGSSHQAGGRREHRRRGDEADQAARPPPRRRRHDPRAQSSDRIDRSAVRSGSRGGTVPAAHEHPSRADREQDAEPQRHEAGARRPIDPVGQPPSLAVMKMPKATSTRAPHGRRSPRLPPD